MWSLDVVSLIAASPGGDPLGRRRVRDLQRETRIGVSGDRFRVRRQYEHRLMDVPAARGELIQQRDVDIKRTDLHAACDPVAVARTSPTRASAPS